MAWQSKAAVLAFLGLAACGGFRESRLNPLNWFGQAAPAESIVLTAEEAADPRPLVAQVLALQLERTPNGAILHARGLPPTQGYWDAALIEVESAEGEDSRRSYTFRLSPPLEPSASGTPFSREVTVALFLTNRELEPLRLITVQGAGNALSVRR